MRVWVSLEDGAEEGRTGGQDHFVSLHLLVLADQCHIKEITDVLEVPKRVANTALKVIPSQAELLLCHDQAIS